MTQTQNKYATRSQLAWPTSELHQCTIELLLNKRHRTEHFRIGLAVAWGERTALTASSKTYDTMATFSLNTGRKS